MKIAVTGALGHIGSHVVRDLPLRLPVTELVMIDNLMTNRVCSLFNLPSIGRYRFIEADVSKADLRPVFAGAHVVVHLAAITDAAGTLDKAELVEANNYQGTRKVAEACIETGAPLITLSSTSVYGTQKTEVAEDCPPEDLKPQSPYAATKIAEEVLVRDLAARGLRAVIFRFGTIFGVSPGMRFHTSVNKFCWQAVMGQPLTVWRTAYDQKRPYLDLSDAGRAFAFAISENLFDGDIYNVLTFNATVRQLVDTIRSFVPALRLTTVDSPLMNQFSYEVSSAKLRGKGFAFCGDLRRGIGDTISLLGAQSH
jgi:UDP-glucose 4-epimerase